MSAARLNKYVVDASAADSFESVPYTAAAAACDAAVSADAYSFPNAAAAPASSATEEKNAFYPVSYFSLKSEGLLPPQTGFHCLKEDIHFDYRRSNKIELQEKDDKAVADEEFDLEFQTSDASLIGSAKEIKAIPKGAHQNVVSFGSSALSAVAASSKYEPYTNDDDDVDEDYGDDDEWATVQMRDAASAGDVGVPRSSFEPAAIASSSKDSPESSPVSFSDAISTMRGSAAVSSRVAQLRPTSSASSSSSGCGALLRRLGFPGAGPPSLSSAASSTRDFLLGLAASPFNDDDPLHSRILRTLYQHLRPGDFSALSSVKRFGKHWEEIGFQGVDPSTDLRGVGMLGLVCLLNWFDGEASNRTATRIFQLSVDPTQNFPFSVTSINVTRMCLQELKRENLNREIGRTERSPTGKYGNDACLSTFMLFYRALFHRLYVEWRDGRKTIADSGFVLKSLEKVWAKNPSKCIEEFSNSKKGGKTKLNSSKDDERKASSNGAKGRKTGKQSTDAVQKFTNLNDL